MGRVPFIFLWPGVTNNNIAKDIKEENDLAQAHPDKVKELRAQLVEWEREMGVEKYSGVQ